MSKSEIRALTTREQCREKLPIFFGSRDNYTHGLLETIMNSRDEILNNFDTGTIDITVSDDLKTITVLDSGRGIPIDGTTDGKPNYVLLFEELFAGTNYDNAELGKVTTGTNGCGSTCLNYTSSYYEAICYKNGKSYKVSYENGGNFLGYEESKQNAIEHGTSITFTLDCEVYTNTIYDIEYIKTLLNRLSSTTDRITYTLMYNGETFTYHYENALDYMENNINNKLSDLLVFEPKTYNLEAETAENVITKEKDTVSVVLSLSTEPMQETYLNGTYLKDNGTIYDGIVDGLRKIFNKEIKNKGKAKLTTQDVEMSFNIHCILDSTAVEFANQTKFSTQKALYKKATSDYIIENMEIVKVEKPKLYEAMVKHLTMINNFNNKNEENIKNIKKKLTEKVDGVGNRVEGAVECIEHGKNSELYICEGKSALGTCVTARNARFQACIAVRGKILSTLKVGYDRIFKSEIIMDIIKMLGCGVQLQDKNKKNSDTFNIDNLRFHKIVLTADSDADGATICCLLLTMFWRLTPYLIENGYIYIAKTPLYEITFEDGTLKYAFNDKEKETLLKGHNLSKCIVKRDKGLGELDPEVMAYTTMNPETRTIERVTVEDAERMSKQFYKWFGEDVSERREHIVENLHKYVTDID